MIPLQLGGLLQFALLPTMFQYLRMIKSFFFELSFHSTALLVVPNLGVSQFWHFFKEIRILTKAGMCLATSEAL